MNTSDLIKGKIPCAETGIEVKKTICDICNPFSHCGLDLYVKDGEIIKVEGSLEHKNSGGTLCSKGAAQRQYVYSKDRIKSPMKLVGEKGCGKLVEISWEEAYTTIADRFNKLKKEEGPERAAFFVGYTKWVRPFVQRLAHSYGSANYCTESSTCFKAMLMAWKLNYGTGCAADIPNTSCALFWSSNPMYTNTTMARMIMDRKENGMKIIAVDPRITPTTALADIHLRLRPATDGALALPMANVIINEGLYDKEFVSKYFHGFDEYKAYVDKFPPERGEAITGVPKEQIIAAARMYAGSKPACFIPSASPVVHHTNGVQNYRAAMLLVGLTGNFDVKGGNLVKPLSWLEVASGFESREGEYMNHRPLSEMGARTGEDKLPVWRDLTNDAQAMYLPEQILTGKPYPITHLMSFGINHRMWPDSQNMLNALKRLEFFVNIDLFHTEACKYADIVLPACSSVERSELKSYGNGVLIWTEPAIKPLYDSKSDADIIFELAKRFDLDDDLMKNGYEYNIDWVLEPSGFKLEEIKKHPGGYAPDLPPLKLKKYEQKGFPTPSGKVEATSEVLRKYQDSFGFTPLPTYKPSEISAENTPELAKEYPFVINTGSRLPMFLHSRTFRLPWTRCLRPDSNADISPADAAALGISQGDDIVVSTPKASIRLKANITDMVLKGVVSIYHGYEDADVNTLIEPDYLDPISGFPGFKSFLGKIVKAGE